MESVVIQQMVNQLLEPELYAEMAEQIYSETSGTVYKGGLKVEG